MSTNEEHLNLDEVRRLLIGALEQVEVLNGTLLPNASTGTRDRNRSIAGLSRDLLFLGHMLDKARVLTLDAYQSARGFTAHLES